uniref:Uncharacterized protein n=1 Tax=Molossus molossus TaxID=27622 RepID=A0A7J8I8I1_MOLMO|nr:hypothetical protein HJG59_010661 [Molossus molossus]
MTITNDHKLGGLKHNSRARSLRSRCHGAMLPPEAPGEGPSCLSQLLRAPGIPGIVAKPLQPLLVTWFFSVCLYLNLPPLFLFFFFLSSPEDIPPFFVQIEWEGERKRETLTRKGHIKWLPPILPNQGQGQTATEVHALSGNRTWVSPDRSPVL